MNRSRSRRVGLWAAFVLLWCMVLVAVYGLSRSVLRLATAERDARHAAAIEENLRLGLWRMDSILAPLIAQQSVMPIPIESVMTRSTAFAASQEVRSKPSLTLPLLASFRFPPGEDQLEIVDASEPSKTDQRDALETPSVHVQSIQLDRMELMGNLTSMASSTRWQPGMEDMAQLDSIGAEVFSSQQNRSRANSEREQRTQNAYLQNSVVLNQPRAMAGPASPPQPLVPIWNQSRLILVRPSASSVDPLEGWVVDWRELKQTMETSIDDLLPDAQFQPIEIATHRSSPDALVSLPALLVPGNVAGDFQDLVSDQGLSVPFVLGTVWLCVLTTACATGWLLANVLRWSDRREAFVAAVTHELRTPLTSLQLYSELLATGMAKDEPTRQSYLVTLQNEVERIGHLVENVFSFARLERGGRPRHCQPSTLKSILDRVERRLHDLAQRSQMQFEVAPDSAWDEWVAVDSSMVEQILVNLVDNACKHAKNDQSPRILLSAHACGRELHVAVRDFGPGIRRPPKRWSPFFKSVEHAADTVHGIGLGLAISQRFAKALGGRLIIDNAEPGARVTLALPMP